MSYQYPYIEHFSPSPTTSTPQAFTQWDIQDDQQSPAAQQQQQQQSLSSEPSPTAYEPPPTIQLQERVRPSSARSVSRGFKHYNPASTGQAAAEPAVRFEAEARQVHEIPGACPTDVPGPVRQHSTNRAQVRFALHPYRRSSAGGAGEKPRQEHDPQGVQTPAPSSAYTTVPCPASQTQDRSGGRGPRNTSPSSMMTISALSPLPPNCPDSPRRLMIRTDMHFATDTNVLTAMFELPGVKKADMTLTLRVCPYSRAKQLTVSGKSGPTFPEDGYTLRERKYGSFHRVLVVPPETTAATVSATMEDGILTLKIPGGTAVHCDEESTEIRIS